MPSTATIASAPTKVVTPFEVVCCVAAFRPALAAGLPLTTLTTTTPREGRPRTSLVTVGSMVATSTPSQACFAWPVAISWRATDLAVALGIANPTPTFASTVPPSICELMPITCPKRSSSGPPELPWLIGASVWIAFWIERPLGAWMSRPVALTIPAVIVRSSPKGFPIAYTGSPTSTFEPANRSGRSAEAGAFTRTTAMSVEGSVPTIAPDRSRRR